MDHLLPPEGTDSFDHQLSNHDTRCSADQPCATGDANHPSGIATQTRPPQTATPSSRAVHAPSRVDLPRFRADLIEAGVEEMLGDLLATFAEDAPIRFAALEAAARDQNPKAIERAAHAFKSGAGTIRATFLAEMLAEVEAAGRAGELKRVGDLIDPMRKEYLAVMLELDAALPK